MLTKFEGGLNLLREADDDAVIWPNIFHLIGKCVLLLC